MAIAIAEVAATGPTSRKALAASCGAPQHGMPRRASSRSAARGSRSWQASARATGPQSTAPVALAYLDDEAALVEAARAVSELTHYDPEAGDACVLWCLAIRHAILTGELDARIGLRHIDADRQDLWTSRLDVAENSKPSDFTNNGWVVEALQAAWCAIATTPIPQDDPARGAFRADHLRLALDAAVRGGERHRHSRRHRRRTTWRCLRGISGPRGLASRAARLAGAGDPRPGDAGHPNREGGHAVQL